MTLWLFFSCLLKDVHLKKYDEAYQIIYLVLQCHGFVLITCYFQGVRGLFFTFLATFAL